MYTYENKLQSLSLTVSRNTMLIIKFSAVFMLAFEVIFIPFLVVVSFNLLSPFMTNNLTIMNTKALHTCIQQDGFLYCMQ